jgi:hypothetical protein
MEDKYVPKTHGSARDDKGILEDSENGGFGTGGIYRAKPFVETNTRETRSGMGFHAGRANLGFYNRKTNGCFRVEKEFFNDIENSIEKYGPLQNAVIYHNRESGHSNESKQVFEKLTLFIDSQIKKMDKIEQPNSATTT